MSADGADAAYAARVAGYTDAELEDVLDHLDAEAWPARRRMVEAERRRRAEGGRALRPADAPVGAAVGPGRPTTLPRPPTPELVKAGAALLVLPGVADAVLLAGLDVPALMWVVVLPPMAADLALAACAWHGRGWAVTVFLLRFAAGVALLAWGLSLVDSAEALREPALVQRTVLSALGLALLLRRPARRWFAACREARRGVEAAPRAA